MSFRGGSLAHNTAVAVAWIDRVRGHRRRFAGDGGAARTRGGRRHTVDAAPALDGDRPHPAGRMSRARAAAGGGSARFAGDDPQVAERVADAARPLAVGPVLDRDDHLGAMSDHALAERVGIVDLDLEKDRGAAEIAR